MNLDAIKKTDAVFLDRQELIAYTLRQHDATFQEIGDALGVSRQYAQEVYRKAEHKVTEAE